MLRFGSAAGFIHLGHCLSLSADHSRAFSAQIEGLENNPCIITELELQFYKAVDPRKPRDTAHERKAMTEVLPQKGAWAIVALLFLFMLINFADKAIIGLAGVPIMAELNLSPRQFGLVGSSFFLLFSVSAVVTGFIVNRIRSKWVLLAMGLIWALVQFPMVGTVGIELLIACRIVLGAGEGPAYPVALHALYKWFPDQSRAVPSAIVVQGGGIGVLLAIPFLNWIITNYNWHYAFGALGAAGVVWVVAWAILSEEGVVQSAATRHSVSISHVSYRALLLCPTNLASWCAYFGAYFGLALVLSWFTPFLVKGLGFDQATAGKLTALPFVVGFVVVIGGSWLSQRLMQAGASSRIARGIVCSASICVGALALIVAPYASNVALKIGLIVAGTSLPSVVYVLSPAILSEIVPDAQRGAVLAINSAVGTSAGIFAPYLMGSIVGSAASASQGYSNGFVICGLVTLTGGLIGLAFLRPERERAAQAARVTAHAIVAPA